MLESHGEQATKELQEVRAKIAQLEAKIAQLEANVTKQAAADPTLTLILQQQLAGLQQQLAGLQQQLATLLAKEERLAATAPAGLYRQIDAHRQMHLSLGGLGSKSTDKMIYAQVALTNDRVTPVCCCKADILMDSGCSLELVLPPRKAVQLKLQKVDERGARSFAKQDVVMTVFAPVLVKILLKNDINQELEKVAFLEPSSRKDEYELELRTNALPKLSWEEYPKVTPDALEFSPIRRRPETAVDSLLGIEGMRKLKLTVDFELGAIMPLVEEDVSDIIVASGCALCPLFDAATSPQLLKSGHN